LIELICEYQNLVALCISPLDILPLESASGSTPSSASSGGGSTFFAYISDLNHQKKISLVLNRLDTLSMDGHLGRVIWYGWRGVTMKICTYPSKQILILTTACVCVLTGIHHTRPKKHMITPPQPRTYVECCLQANHLSQPLQQKMTKEIILNS
jgi:hypothetical protein